MKIKELIKNKIIKRSAITISAFVILIGIMSITYNLFNQSGIANYQIYSYLKKENPTFGLGIIRSEIIEFDQKNSISNYLNPIYTLILESENFKGGYVVNYSRGFPLQELYIKGKASIKSFTIKDDKKSFEDIVKLAKEKNISTLENTDDIYSGRNKEGFDLDDDYFDGLELNKNDDSEKGNLISHYNIFIPNEKLLEYFNRPFRLDLSTSGKATDQKYREAHTLLFDKEYPNAKFISLAYTNGIADKHINDSFLKSIYIIKKDRTIIEIPIVDGKFDWKSVDGELKK
jgi:hypothetical protein